MNLPHPIKTYFDADRRCDGDALIDAFVAEAIVIDEGRSHHGRQAIEGWWRDGKARYEHVVEPLEAEGHDEVRNVRARVTGQFPGSPAILTFAFRLRGDRITHLEIGA